MSPPRRWSSLDPGPRDPRDIGTTMSVALRRVQRQEADGLIDLDDPVAVEEPLEIRLEGKPAAVTMRTPGEDLDLVAGFLFTEGVVDGADDIVAIAHVDDPADPRGNTVDVRLSPGVPAHRRERAVRELFASSSCGVCGKASIALLHQRIPPLDDDQGGQFGWSEVCRGLAAAAEGQPTPLGALVNVGLADAAIHHRGIGQQLRWVGAFAKEMCQEHQLIDDPVDQSLAKG